MCEDYGHNYVLYAIYQHHVKSNGEEQYSKQVGTGLEKIDVMVNIVAKLVIICQLLSLVWCAAGP